MKVPYLSPESRTLFTQTLLERLPDVADENPVKLAFGIARLILDIEEVG